MEKTNVRACFSLYGDEFPLEYVTEKIGLKPSMGYRKGDLISAKQSDKLGITIQRKETAWQLETNYEESLDVDNQLSKIIDILHGKREVINEIRKDFELECRLDIVIIMEKGYTPAFSLNRKVIDFIHFIQAEIEIDLYANPY
ncbi:DUF4279 domain-containing protein [Paenibacillus assamensis]|uniref:DUF4279 domain-containing protein n=1 Tax=Paenibacillus assamensis TaxID=311244 RepID=UPI00048F93E0|nr:DUF4279 domain-containing protein [Paenibacillus assamensis]